MPGSPDVKNYYIGTGIVSFKATADTAFRDLGNVAKVTLKPVLTTKEHNTSRAGSRSVDRTLVTARKVEVTLDIEEITPENLALFWSGDMAVVSLKKTITLFTHNSIIGELKFHGTNGVGSQYDVDLLRVEFVPSNQMDLIGTDLMSLTLTGVASQVGGSFGTITEMAEEAA